MYPNPQDVLPLPPHPDLHHYRKRAKELVRACHAGGDAIAEWAASWLHALHEHTGDATPAPPRDKERSAQQIAAFARARVTESNCALSQAQFVIARAHGFASWPKFAQHLAALSTGVSALSAFERAADAIVTGDLDTLKRLLEEQPGLVRARSSREHNATLLHYVSANGVENFRQRTPSGIVAIAQYLLDEGAEVDAEANVYGGGATTLGLVVTSTPPRQAGAQLPLADLLVRSGARIDGDIVRSCLANGCPEAAAHMAALGAPVTLEDAAGIGRLDLLAVCFLPPRTASAAEAVKALLMAAWYGRVDVVAWLLDHGVPAGSGDAKEGQTALHLAAYQGNAELVELLVSRGAPLDVTDASYGTPPFVWALHGWLAEGRRPAERYHAVLRILADAGAHVNPEWLHDPRLQENAELYALLSQRAAAG